MKPALIKQYFLIFELILLSACAPQQVTPSATVSAAPASPSLESINLAGPEMQVGSTWLYADGSLLIPVPAGIFTMGHGGPDDPQHQVNLSGFWIYRTKVTNAQYAYCVSQGQCTSPNKTDNPGYTDPTKTQNPVTGVDYSQAAAYCGFVHARLPTRWRAQRPSWAAPSPSPHQACRRP